MFVLCKLLLILMIFDLTFASDQNVLTTVIHDSKKVCNSTVVKELEECWNGLPPMNVHRIPSSPKEIENACSIFVSGMECVDNWSRTCLSNDGQRKIEGSVFGALQIYEYLCKDEKFRQDYLRHAQCYRKISPLWNYCNNKFINTLKRVDHARDKLSLCCIRQKYVQCVNNVTTALCSNVANKYLLSITESLIYSPLQPYHSSQCVNVDQRNCSRRSSAASQTTTITISRICYCFGSLKPIKNWILGIFITFRICRYL